MIRYLGIQERIVSTSIGRHAEDTVASYLQRQGYEIIDQNWRTRRCEIDIIAKKKKRITFVEVKYRGQQAQGDGFAYITPKKIQQMSFAAELWVATTQWKGEYCLAAAAVSGEDVDYREL